MKHLKDLEGNAIAIKILEENSKDAYTKTDSGIFTGDITDVSTHRTAEILLTSDALDEGVKKRAHVGRKIMISVIKGREKRYRIEDEEWYLITPSDIAGYL